MARIRRIYGGEKRGLRRNLEQIDIPTALVMHRIGTQLYWKPQLSRKCHVNAFEADGAEERITRGTRYWFVEAES